MILNSDNVKTNGITPRFKPMDQVRYTSTGVDIVEEGFITKVDDDGWAWVRYWNKSNPTELRTKGNSERTRISQLKHFKSHTPQQLWDAVEKYGIKVQGVYNGTSWIYEDYDKGE
jgi:hypothetical protein